MAAISTDTADWTEVAVAMDRCLRTFAEFSKPFLVRHGVPTLSFGSLLFLMAIGNNGLRVSDLVRRGRHLGSNVSYALKSLENAGLIDRSLDADDRRNVYVRWTDAGRSLAVELIAAGGSASADSAQVLLAIEQFETWFARPESQ